MSEIDPNDLAMWEVDDLPDAVDDRILAELAASRDPVEAATPEQRPVRRWPWLAAGLAVAAALVLVWAVRPQPAHQSGEIVVAAARRTVAVTDRARATVEVGGELRWVANGAAISVEQHAGSVRYEVSPGGPFTVVTPVATVEVTGTVFTVDVLTDISTNVIVDVPASESAMTQQSRPSSRSARRLALAASLAGATGLAFVAVDEGDVALSNEHGTTVVGAGQSAAADDISAPKLSDSRAEPSPSGRSRHAAAHPAKASADARRTKRAAMRAKIEEAIAARPKADSAPAADDDSPRDQPRGTLTKDYIREVVREDVIPLARDCYNSVLEDDPDFGGKLVLDFEILGDESVGGIVDNVLPGEGTTLAHPDFVECMSESMMSVVFDPPEGGGIVHISYPFVFEAE